MVGIEWTRSMHASSASLKCANRMIYFHSGAIEDVQKSIIELLPRLASTQRCFSRFETFVHGFLCATACFGRQSRSQSRVDYAECILQLPSSVENFENHVLTKSPFVWHLEDKIPQLISSRPHLVMFDSVECVLNEVYAGDVIGVILKLPNTADAELVSSDAFNKVLAKAKPLRLTDSMQLPAASVTLLFHFGAAGVLQFQATADQRPLKSKRNSNKKSALQRRWSIFWFKVPTNGDICSLTGHLVEPLKSLKDNCIMIICKIDHQSFVHVHTIHLFKQLIFDPW
ncbi:hypothetical protein T05_6795 [Trichinella murrelli]|uniref:Uncharacterized protein n=1 Tax=Trichinella murrelli TaxID=144512 RepID=A0A0V0U2K1_9BILA|nr:hypothetical protein T05_6795 [Trichinella murrelli]